MRKAALLVVCFMVAFAVVVHAEDARNAQSMRGTVIGVDPDGKGISVEGKLDGKAWVVAAVVTPETRILLKGKKDASLSDIKEGDKIDLKWTRMENDLYATSIAKH